jgi:hypothetical protein
MHKVNAFFFPTAKTDLRRDRCRSRVYGRISIKFEPLPERLQTSPRSEFGRPRSNRFGLGALSRPGIRNFPASITRPPTVRLRRNSNGRYMWSRSTFNMCFDSCSSTDGGAFPPGKIPTLIPIFLSYARKFLYRVDIAAGHHVCFRLKQ